MVGDELEKRGEGGEDKRRVLAVGIESCTIIDLVV